MATLEKVYEEIKNIDKAIGRLLKYTLDNNYEFMDEIDLDKKDCEQIFLSEEVYTVLSKLQEVHDKLEYLHNPVKETGRLHRNKSGRYELESGFEFTCGCRIEALIEDGYHETPYWSSTSIEHNGKDYYLVGHPSVSPDGLKVRHR